MLVDTCLAALAYAGLITSADPSEKREEAWGRLATDLDLEKLNSMPSRAGLDDSAGFGGRSPRGKNARTHHLSTDQRGPI
jgi:hypothetical protein